jgi:hypothetical protein
MDMEMAWRIELDPVRSIVPTRPAICDGQSKQQVATGFDEASEGREATDRILHVLKAVMGHHEVIATAMLFR